jgi:hypothetical protein
MTESESNRLWCVAGTLILPAASVFYALTILVTFAGIDVRLLESVMIACSAPWFAYWALWCNIARRTKFAGMAFDDSNNIDIHAEHTHHVHLKKIFLMSGILLITLPIIISGFFLFYKSLLET